MFEPGSGIGAEILVEGLAADAELSGQGGFRFTSPSVGSQLVNLIGGEGFAAAAVCPALYPTRQPGQSGGLPGERLYRAGATATGSDLIATKA